METTHFALWENGGWGKKLQSGAEKKLKHRAVCEYNLRKFLLSNDFILVEC